MAPDRAEAVRSVARAALARRGGQSELVATSLPLSTSSSSQRPPAVFTRIPARDGQHSRNPDYEWRSSPEPYRSHAGDVGAHPDHGDSMTRLRYGDHRYGRTIKSGDIGLSGSTMEPSPSRPGSGRNLRLQRNYIKISSTSEEEPSWEHGQPKYGARGVSSEPYEYMPPPRKLLPAKQAGEVEILVGYPHSLPKGITSVFLSAESDDGAYDASDRMHVRKGVSWSGSEGALGGALVLTCQSATKVTLHVMAEASKTDPYGQPRTLGGTTIALPPPNSATPGSKQRLYLVAPLEITVELAWIPDDKSWRLPKQAQRRPHQPPAHQQHQEQQQQQQWKMRLPPRSPKGQQGADKGGGNWRFDAPPREPPAKLRQQQQPPPQHQNQNQPRRPPTVPLSEWIPQDARPDGLGKASWREYKPDDVPTDADDDGLYGNSGPRYQDGYSNYKGALTKEESEQYQKWLKYGFEEEEEEGFYDDDDERAAAADADYMYAFPDKEVGTWKHIGSGPGPLSRAAADAAAKRNGSRPSGRVRGGERMMDMEEEEQKAPEMKPYNARAPKQRSLYARRAGR